MVVNGGNQEGLFRAAIMQSGSPPILSDITDGQKHYDALVQETGCVGISDTLECLRQTPYEQLKAAVQKSPGLFEHNVGGSSFLLLSQTDVRKELRSDMANTHRWRFHYRQSVQART
jgi:carboxylesterase type B